jgi:hypothetical protein
MCIFAELHNTGHSFDAVRTRPFFQPKRGHIENRRIISSHMLFTFKHDFLLPLLTSITHLRRRCCPHIHTIITATIMSSPNRANPEASAMLSRILAVAGITSSPNPKVSAILIRISAVAQAFEKNEPGARESLIDLSQALITALELPSEAIQRMGWAEVSLMIFSFNA